MAENFKICDCEPKELLEFEYKKSTLIIKCGNCHQIWSSLSDKA